MLIVQIKYLAKSGIIYKAHKISNKISKWNIPKNNKNQRFCEEISS